MARGAVAAVQDFAAMHGAGIGRLAGLFASVSLAVLALGTAPLTASAATRATAAGKPSQPTALPSLPPVPLALTEGHSAPALLQKAIALSSLGMDSSALMAAVDATQVRMDDDATMSERSTREAAAADKAAQAALRSASDAEISLAAMTGAVKQAVLDLYTDGGSGIALNPLAGPLRSMRRSTPRRRPGPGEVPRPQEIRTATAPSAAPGAGIRLEKAAGLRQRRSRRPP